MKLTHPAWNRDSKSNLVATDIMEQDHMLVFTLISAGGSCTNGGVTDKFNHFTLCDSIETAEKVVAAGHDTPEDVLVLDLVIPNLPRAVPYSLLLSGDWTMFGGNYVVTCDSRFVWRHPIMVMDRVER